MYYPRENRLISLDMLKLYQGEVVVCQNPEDIDPDRWLDKGELVELPEVPTTEAEERSETEGDTPETHGADMGPYLEISMLPENPEVTETREGIHAEIQA